MEVHHPPDIHHKRKKFKEYFLEFLMLFLAVTMGFFAENIRENIVNHEREEHYVKSILTDLQKDTANISLSLHSQDWLLKKMDRVLQLPVEKLRDVSFQDTLYRNLVPFYAGYWVFVQSNNAETQLKNAGGFNVFSNQKAIDSITEVYFYYDSWLKMNSEGYIKSYEKTDNLAAQLFRLPETDISFDDSSTPEIPGKILIQYNIILLEQFYTNIRYQKGQLLACIEFEKEYGRKVERLIGFLQKEYDLKNE
jgi:hypothetical protein